MRREENKKKRGQITIFLIIAIIIIAIVIIYFLFKGELELGGVPKQFDPVYDYYLSCIDNEVKLGASLAGQQAGYINIDELEFSPGTVYMPFSSQLDFLSNPIPYWYYISGNGLIKEQIPTKDKIERQLNNFVKERIYECDFSSFTDQGFRIEINKDSEVTTKINNNNIETEIIQDVRMYFGNESFIANNHKKQVNSNLGKMYDTSRKIYDSFKETQFLENYGVDILRLYAPVDGTEISCSPLLWNIGTVRENITKAIEANTGFIKIKGDYYQLKNQDNNYFVQDIGEEVDSHVNFLYLREWPMKMQVWPSDNGLLRADPIGLEEGFGMLGFCYVPYHFVYDLAYPILIQQFYDNELFQFPVVVYINKNRPREPLQGEAELPISELCLYKNTKIKVLTYNNNLEPIEADISFKCFDTECSIGKTNFINQDSILEENFPQCVNGYLIARTNGYETGRYLISTVNEQELSVTLNKEHELNIHINKKGSPLSSNENAVLSFTKENNQKIINYPEQNKITLSEGQYTIKAYIYSKTNIPLEPSINEKCIEVSKSGILGILGSVEEKCFELEIPGQTIETGISGGGTQEHYITDSELNTANKIIIDAENFGVPENIKDIQLNYNFLESSRMNIRIE